MLLNLKKTLRSLALLGSTAGIFVAAPAQNFVYSNNGSSPTNGVAGFSVGSDGTLTQIAGSPFSAVGNGSTGYFAGRSIAIWGNFLFASNGSSNNVAAFTINPATGVLTTVQGSPFALTGVSAGSGITLAVSQDGKYLFTGAKGITVQAIGPNGALTQVSSISLTTSIDTIDISPDGQFLAYTDTSSIGLYSIAANGTLTSSGTPVTNVSSATSVKFDPNNASGNRLYVGCSGAAVVAAFNVAANGTLTAITGSPFTFGGLNPNSIGISPNGQYLYLADQATGDASPTVIAIASDGTLSQLYAPGTMAGTTGVGLNIAISGDGKFLYSGSEGGPVYDFSIGTTGALSGGKVSAVSTTFSKVATYPAANGGPVSDLSTSSLTFASQQFETQSAAQTVTITNNGVGNLAVSSAAISGTNANDFALTNNCPATVSAGNGCTIAVTFTPAGVGARSASLAIVSNSGGAAGTTQSVTLQGTAIQQTPSMTAATASASYGATSALLSAQLYYVGSTVPTGAVTFAVNGGSAVSASCPGSTSPLNCTASYPTSQLPVGTYNITASVAADTNFAAASGNAQLTINAFAPTMTFSISNHIYGNVPFTVQASSNSSAAITYTLLSGPATISGSTLAIIGAGRVTVRASQQANSSYSATTQTASFSVAQAPLAITASSQPMTFGGTVPAITPSYSTFAYSDTPASLGTVTCSTTATSSSQVGSYPSSCSGATGANYSITYVNGTVTIGDGTLTIAANNATRVYGTNNPTFTGSVSGQQSGQSLTESFTTTATISSPVGSYPIIPSVTGATLSDYQQSVTDGKLTITQAGSTTGLAASSATITPGQNVTLTATVASATSGTPGGTVNFYNNGTLLNAAPITLNAGAASYTTAALAAGMTNSLTATYSGDTDFSASSTASATPVTVAALNFTMAVVGANTVTVVPGSRATYQVQVAPDYGSYPAEVSFTASALPEGATASFSPSTIAANGGQQTVAVTIQTPAAVAAATLEGQPATPGSSGRRQPFALAFFLLLGAGSLRKRGRVIGRMSAMMFLLAASGAALLTLSGCGTNNGFLNQAVKNYSVTITAASSGVTHSQNVTLNVQ